jgi:hypothetical protein
MRVVWPAFALFALTMLSVARLARMRFAAASAGRVDPRFYKLFRGDGDRVRGGRVRAPAGRARLGLRRLPGRAHRDPLEFE